MDLKLALRTAKNPDCSPEQLDALHGQGETVDRLLAKHPKASAELLEKLSRSADKTTRKYVAIHPNAAKSVLLALASQFPGDFFKNPAFDWLLLEEPDLLFELGHGVLKNILKRPDCPESFMAWAVERGDEQQKLAVAMNPQASEGILRSLVKQGGNPAAAAMSHGRLAGDVVLIDVSREFDDLIKKLLQNLYPTEIKDMWKKGSVGPNQWPWFHLTARLLVPSRSGLKEFEQMYLLRQPKSRMPMTGREARAAITYGGGRSDSEMRDDIEFLESMSRSRSLKIRLLAAENIFATEDLLEYLSQDKHDNVRRAVVENVATSGMLLERMANDESLYVRLGVASSAGTPSNVLREFAKSTDKVVRIILASNPTVPQELLTDLANDRSVDVRANVAGNISTPLDILRKLALKGDETVVVELARNPSCPEDLRREAVARLWWRGVEKFAIQLSFDLSGMVWTLATPELLISAHQEECSNILENPTKSIIARIMGTNESAVSEISDENASAASRSSIAVVKLLGLCHRNADMEALISAHRSTDWAERLAVARNPGAPSGVIAALTKDPHRMVAQQAHETERVKAEGKALELRAAKSPA